MRIEENAGGSLSYHGGVEPKPFSAREHFDRIDRENRADLEAAILEAERTGKEEFNLERLTGLAGLGDLRAREGALKLMYYISERELQTLDEFAEHLWEMSLWGNF